MQPIKDKKRFAAAVMVFIKHKKTLADTSANSYYRNPLFMNSIGQCHSLVLMAKRDCNEYNFSSLCKVVLMHEKHLRNILPSFSNKSYKSQVETLENLILTANTYKK